MSTQDYVWYDLEPRLNAINLLEDIIKETLTTNGLQESALPVLQWSDNSLYVGFSLTLDKTEAREQQIKHDLINTGKFKFIRTSIYRKVDGQIIPDTTEWSASDEQN